MVVTDAFTKFATAVAIPGKEAMHMAPALLSHFYTCGIPMQLVTDQGREYCNELKEHLWTALKISQDVTMPYRPGCNSAMETFNKIFKHYIATTLVDAEASTRDWEAYLAPLLFAYNRAVSSSTKVTPFKATLRYYPRVPLWEGVEYSGEEIVERKDFAEYLAEVKHTQLRTRQIPHQNNQQVRQEYKDKYDAANKVVYPKYVAGDQVWIEVKDKNQQSDNPKLAPIWERGTFVERGITGTRYRVDRPGRKTKKVITVNVQQLKPYKVQEEQTEIAKQPPVPPGEDEQQQSTDKHESEGEEEEYDMTEVDLGPEEEESKEAYPHLLDTMREPLAILKDTPLPQQDTPL
jgi:hypothetical protein